MSQTKNLAGHPGMLSRPRINELIKDGLDQPLLVMLAGPGYGKTQAMAQYISKSNANNIWVRLGSLDNLCSHFWDHFLRSFIREFPAHTEYLQSLKFPESLQDFSMFVRFIESNIPSDSQSIWVFDDYGEITNQQIKDFMHRIIDANLNTVRLVLISNDFNSMEAAAFMTRKRSLISAQDLCFTHDEILSLYQLHNIRLTQSDIEDIHLYTGGWPLPLHLLVLQYDKLPKLLSQDSRLTEHSISDMFEEKFFSAYTASQKRMVIKLSMLDSFTRDFAVSVYEGDKVKLEILENHAFLIEEPHSNHMFFHHLYRLFLKEKAYLLSSREIYELWEMAAAYYTKTGNAANAVVCYRKCENYPAMLNVIYNYIQSNDETTYGTACYFLEYISLLSPRQVKAYPLADYLRAYLYMLLLRLEESELLLLNLEKRLLLNEESPENYNLMCDVCSTLGCVYMMQNRECFLDAFEKAAKAAEHIPPEILAKKSGRMRMNNANSFSMADNLPGAKERMEQAIHRAMPYISKIWSGDLIGIEYMFSAESAYLSFELDKAQENAYRCLYTSEAHAQHDLAANAYRLLARIGYIQGNYSGMKKNVDLAVEYASRHNNAVMRNIRDNTLAWYYIKLLDFEKIPKSTLEYTGSEEHHLSLGRSQVTYAHYLISAGEYSRAIAMLSHAKKGLYLSRGIWQETIINSLMLAVANHCMGNIEASLSALWSAYDLCYSNGLVTLFIEVSEYMYRIIQNARRQEQYEFSPQWLDFISRESLAFSKRAEKVHAEYNKQNLLKRNADNPLSKREKEVLQSAARGLTMEEIAAEQYVSINTVKTTLRNIYNKLSASNKAEAVAIAIENDYI